MAVITNSKEKVLKDYRSSIEHFAEEHRNFLFNYYHDNNKHLIILENILIHSNSINAIGRPAEYLTQLSPNIIDDFAKKNKLARLILINGIAKKDSIIKIEELSKNYPDNLKLIEADYDIFKERYFWRLGFNFLNSDSKAIMYEKKSENTKYRKASFNFERFSTKSDKNFDALWLFLSQKVNSN